MNITKLSALCFLMFSLVASATSLRTSDPSQDQDTPASCYDGVTDMASGVWTTTPEYYIVKMKMHNAVQVKEGYREYYFWVDVNPAAKSGYQPYMPHDVAWPNLYADYRIFLSLDIDGNDDYQRTRKLWMQDCRKQDCATDARVTSQPSGLSYSIEGDTVTFMIAAHLIPELILPGTAFKVGYTTYFSDLHCSGEDDLPQWGEDAIDELTPGGDQCEEQEQDQEQDQNPIQDPVQDPACEPKQPTPPKPAFIN